MSQINKEIAAAVGILGEAWRQKVTPATIKAYQIGLDDLTSEAVKTATTRAIRQCKFMPTVSELRELAGETSHGDRAVLAWGAFEKAVQGIGYYRSPDFDDPIINATCRNLGGWMAACCTEGEEFDKWYRQRFLKTYEVLSRRGVGDEESAPLIGCVQRENGRLGYDRKEKVQVPTGLPWAGEHRKRIEQNRPTNGPRVEFQKV